MSGLSKELVFLILQFLDEEKYKQTLHMLERESGVFCNMDYIAELVTKGDWEVLDKYLAGFISINDNQYSVKMLFNIRKQRYIEALEQNDRSRALEILKRDLRPFKTINEDIFVDLTHLLTLSDIRENQQLSNYIDNKTERAKLVQELKILYEANPDLHDKRKFPTITHARLQLLVNQGLNWQHKLCKNPRHDPDVTSLFEDHVCGSSQTAPAPSPAPAPGPETTPLANNQLMGPIHRAAAFLHPPFHPIEPPFFLRASHSQGLVNPPSLTPMPVSGVLVRASHNTGLDTELLTRRTRHFGMFDEVQNLPSSSTARPAAHNFLSTDDVPKNVITVLRQGSEVKTMDFHPEHQTLLAVGTNTGDVTIWEIANQLRIVHRKFNVWNIGAYSIPLQVFLNNECLTMVNRVMWSPDGIFLGVAYSKHIIHLYSFCAGDDLRKHLEIEAHAGYVSDLAFTIRNQTLLVITCGEDRLIKVWDAETGANLYIFKGHNAPVSSVCPRVKENIQFIFSTSIDGSIKVWLYDEPLSSVDYQTPGLVWNMMACNGPRFFSSGSNERESFLVEWIDSQGTVKRAYQGLAKESSVIQFDTAGRFIAAGNEFIIKFWDIDNRYPLCSTDAEGGLPASPCLRFCKGGILLAVSTCDNCVKILGNQEGFRLVKSVKEHPEALRLASAKAAKASIVTTGFDASTSSAGTSTGLIPVRSLSFPVMPAANQEDQIMSDAIVIRTEEVEPPVVSRGPKEITEPLQIRSLRLPDTLLPVEVLKIAYTQRGGGILALAYNAVHKLWRWPKNEQTQTASADVAPQLWQPSSGILMTNDVKDAKLEDTLACLAVSNNHCYAVSTSGGKVALYNLVTFETLSTFFAPPPVVTSLIFHPGDNNMVIAGMSDGSIIVYNVKFDEVKQKLPGHKKCVTGLAFAVERNALISTGTGGQLCVWDTESWKMLTSQFIKFPARRTNNLQAPTRVYLSPAQTHFMVVHEAQIAVFNILQMDSCCQWAPQSTSGAITDAIYSCDGELIYACVEDGSVAILAANTVMLKCVINRAAYMPLKKRSAIRVCPNAIAAHPSKPNQFALGLSDGAVYVLEPLESDKKWGDEPTGETSAGPSTNPDSDEIMVVD